MQTYSSHIKEYLEYSEAKGLEPDSDIALASFMKHCVTERQRKLGISTVTRVIPSAVNDYFQFRSGKKPGDSPLVLKMKKAIRDSTPKSNLGRLPITPEMLETMVCQMGDSNEEIRNMFLIILMTLGMLRESEAVALRVSDIQEEKQLNQVFLRIIIRKSKTDQESEGAAVNLAETKTSLCPVQWWRIFFPTRNPKSEFVFHQMGNTLPLSRKTPNHIVKNMLKSIGIDPTKYGSHSCRKGGCTTAVNAGVDLRLVSRHGRWQSNVVMDYIQDSMDAKLSVSQAILKEK